MNRHLTQLVEFIFKKMCCKFGKTKNQCNFIFEIEKASKASEFGFFDFKNKV